MMIPHFTSNQERHNALISASCGGHLEVIAILIEKGATIDAATKVIKCDAMYGV
jgi:ankyrin repeat protein